MPIDTSIYGQLQQPKIDSPLNALAQVSQIKAMQNQNRLADLTFSQHQRSLDSDNALASLLAKPGTDVAQGLAAQGYGNAALAYTKQQQELGKTKSEIDKNSASAKKTSLEAANIALTQHRDMLNTVNDPQSGAQWLVSAYQNPDTKAIFERMGPLDEALRRYQQAISTPEGFAKWKQGASLTAENLVKYTTPDANAQLSAQTSRANNAATNATSRANNQATVGAMLDANNINKEAARTQVVETPEGLALVDKGTGQVRPAMGAGGEQVQQKDSPKYQAQKQQSQLEAGIKMARDLIPKATASGAGALADSAAGFFGKSTPGADAASQLDTLAGWMTTNVPRMQGPQSDKDTLLYRQMAAQVGDRTKPASQRLAALNTLEKLQQKYATIAGNAPTPKATGGKPSLDDIFK